MPFICDCHKLDCVLQKEDEKRPGIPISVSTPENIYNSQHDIFRPQNWAEGNICDTEELL